MSHAESKQNLCPSTQQIMEIKGGAGGKNRATVTDHAYPPQCNQKASGKPSHFQSLYQESRKASEQTQGLSTHNFSYNYSITKRDEDSKHTLLSGFSFPSIILKLR